MTEPLARAALTSDRWAARFDTRQLWLVDGALVAESDRGRRNVTSTLRNATFIDWTELPPTVSLTAGNGGILLSGDKGSWLLAVDDWWMEPVMVTSRELALRSSGLNVLLERFPRHDESSVEALVREANLVRPAGHRAARSTALMTAIVIGGGLAFLAVVYGPLVTTLVNGPGSDAVWVAIKTLVLLTLATAVFVALSGRIRRKRVEDHGIAPADGPSWFRRTACIGLRNELVVLRDGQGAEQLLSVDQAGSGDAALRRAEFIEGEDGAAAVLRDGTGTIRAQLPAWAWFPDEVRRSELWEWLTARGILTSSTPTTEWAASRSLDPQRSRTISVESLANGRLGVQPIPLVAAAAFFCGLVASVPMTEEALPLRIIGWVLAVAVVVAVFATVIIESATRIPVARHVQDPAPTPGRFPTRGQRNIAIAALAGGALSGWFLHRDNWLGAIDAALFAGVFVIGSWLMSRRRLAERGHRPLGFVRWLRTGAQRGDE